jgi:hypothetical protein
MVRNLSYLQSARAHTHTRTRTLTDAHTRNRGFGKHPQKNKSERGKAAAVTAIKNENCRFRQKPIYVGLFFCLLAFTVFFSIVLVAGLLAYGVLVFIVRRRCAGLARCASAGIYRRARRDSAFERQLLLLLLVACWYFFFSRDPSSCCSHARKA